MSVRILLGPVPPAAPPPPQGSPAHGLIKVEWQGAATDETALVFGTNCIDSPVATLETGSMANRFSEVDVAGLPTRQLAKRRPPLLTGVPSRSPPG